MVDTKNFKVIARISSMKVVQEDRFLAQTGYLKTKLVRSFNVIKKRDNPMLGTEWMWHMGLLRISFQKNWNIEKHALTGYHILSTVEECALRVAACKKSKTILLASEKRGNTFLNRIVTGDKSMNRGAIITYWPVNSLYWHWDLNLY